MSVSAESPPTSTPRPAGFPWLAVVIWTLLGAGAGMRAGSQPPESFGHALWETLIWGGGAAILGGVIGLGVGMFIGGPGDTWGQRFISGVVMMLVVSLALFVAAFMGIGAINLVGWLTGGIGWWQGISIGAVVGGLLPVLQWLLGKRRRF